MIKNISPPEEPEEDLKHICSDLKALRESRGLTLNDLFQITKISPLNLEAIENGDFHLLPPPVYTKAFIKTYVQIIGIDSKEVLDRYERYLETSKTPAKKEEAPKSLKIIRGHYKKLFLSLSFVAGIVIFCISLHYYYKTGVETPYYHAGTTVSSTSDVKPADAANRQVESKTADQAGAETSYHLSIEARELTWLRIREGQNSPYEILLQPGEKIERIAPSFVIDVGNAGGINVEFQGTPLARLGELGQVVHLRLP